MRRASIAMKRQLESTDHRPILHLESLEHCGRPHGIARNRQVKRSNRQIVQDLKVIEAEARETNKVWKGILEKIGV